MQSVPWCDCEIAFDVDEPEAMDRLDEDLLPNGWELHEVYGSPTTCIAIFNVSVLPTIEDGETVARLLKEAHAY